MSDLNNGLVLHYLLEKHDGLPVGYTRLEYIASTSAGQCLRLPITSNCDDFEYDIMIRYTKDQTYSSYVMIFGSRPSSDSSQEAYWGTEAGTPFESGINHSYQYRNSSINLNDYNIHRIYRYNNNTTMWADGNTSSSSQSSSARTKTSQTMGIFRMSSSDTAFEGIRQSAAIYHLYVHSASQEKEINLIPAKRISDSVIGMYDVENDVFYVNQGGGTFVAGPEITPTKEYDINNSTTTRSDDGNLINMNGYEDDSPIYHNAIKFNGSSSRIQIPNQPLTSSTPNLTLCAWVKLNNTYAHMYCCRTSTGGPGWLFSCQTGTCAFDDGTRWQPDYKMTNGVWTHCCWVRTTSMKALYINGKLYASTTTLGNLGSIYTTGYIGNNVTNDSMGSEWSNMSMSDFRIYNRALSADEIAELYAMGVK